MANYYASCIISKKKHVLTHSGVKKVHGMLRTSPAQRSTMKDRDDDVSWFKVCRSPSIDVVKHYASCMIRKKMHDFMHFSVKESA